MSFPPPPFKVSFPPPPLRILFAPLPVIVLATVFPVPLIAAPPVKVKFSTFVAIVKVTED